MNTAFDICLAVLAALVLTSPVSCSVYESSQLAAAAARGEDPLRLACAMSPNTLMRSEACRALAAVPARGPR